MAYAVATAGLFLCLFVWARWFRKDREQGMGSMPSLDLIQSDRRVRELTAQAGHLHADRAELQDKLDDSTRENTRLRSELWRREKKLRDIRRLADADIETETVEAVS